MTHRGFVWRQGATYEQSWRHGWVEPQGQLWPNGGKKDGFRAFELSWGPKEKYVFKPLPGSRKKKR
jgi:hypothetical protein